MRMSLDNLFNIQMNKSKVKAKLPEKWPEWICKCVWDATAVKIVVEAKDEAMAWDRAWKRVARTEGGDSCLQVKVLRMK